MSRAAPQRKNVTLALRIQFNGRDGLTISNTHQGHLQSLVPWLRNILTNLRLPHPKPTNIVKPSDGTGVIDMYWDVERENLLVRSIVQRCRETETSTLQERSIICLMVFVLPPNMRKIPSGILPAMSRRCPVDDSTTIGSSSSRPATTTLEVALLAVFESIGVSLPAQIEDLAPYIPILSKYIQMMRDTASRETAARAEAEAALAEERARHARILQDIQRECREPFIVPALLDAFVVLSQTVDTISQSQTI